MDRKLFRNNLKLFENLVKLRMNNRLSYATTELENLILLHN
jgi:hypothetical protein